MMTDFNAIGNPATHGISYHLPYQCI